MIDQKETWIIFFVVLTENCSKNFFFEKKKLQSDLMFERHCGIQALNSMYHPFRHPYYLFLMFDRREILIPLSVVQTKNLFFDKKTSSLMILMAWFHFQIWRLKCSLKRNICLKFLVSTTKYSIQDSSRSTIKYKIQY